MGSDPAGDFQATGLDVVGDLSTRRAAVDEADGEVGVQQIAHTPRVRQAEQSCK